MDVTGPGCPRDEQVALFVDGKLSSGDLALVQAHLDQCAACRALVAGAAQTRWGPEQADSDTLPAAGLPRPTGRLEKGVLVGRYMVLDFVASGGMASVYAAYDPELDRRVALKLLRNAERNSDGRGLLLREAQVLARFSHPNVVTVYDTGAFGDQVFLAMELVEGGTLRGWLSAGRSRAEVLTVLGAAGEGLAAAHRAGLVHRDFKPDNVLIGRDGRARVTDFGLAGPSGVGEGKLMGTPAYMAPEQMAGEPSDARADLFSFCVTLYEALYGERPFAGDSLSTLRDAIRSGALREPPSQRRAPEWLHRLVCSGLRADPAERPASMELLLAGLRVDLRQRRRWAAAAGLLLLAASTGMLGQRAISARAASCAAVSLDGAWDAGRREAMRASFARSGLPYSATSFASAARLLDDYAQKWSAMSVEACEATRVRHQQPEETLALRAACLDDRRRELGALTEVFSTADHEVVDHAAAAAGGLTEVAGCANLTALAQPIPRPRDAAARARLDAALGKTDQAFALLLAGKASERAVALSAEGLAGARAVGHAPSEAYAGICLANVESRLGRIDKARSHFEEALYDGQRGRDDRQVINALVSLTEVVGTFGGHTDEGLRYGRLAASTIERFGNPLDQLAALQATRSTVLLAAGRLDEALADRREATAAWEKLDGPNSLRTLESRSNLGLILMAQGRLEESRAQFAEVLPAIEKLAGVGNPETLLAKSNLGSALLMLGRTDEAAPILEAVAREIEHAYGAQSSYFANTQINLGELNIARGQLAEGMAQELRAIALLEAVSKDHPALWEPLTQVGIALVGLGRATEALAPLERALVIAKSGIAPTDLARIQFAMARALVAAHRDAARARGLAESAHKAWQDAAERWGGENRRFAGEIARFLEPT